MSKKKVLPEPVLGESQVEAAVPQVEEPVELNLSTKAGVEVLKLEKRLNAANGREYNYLLLADRSEMLLSDEELSKFTISTK